ncbi:MAG: hypothetical protein K6C36_01875 [Clostridia bacterium]|nr:hypothetical protein [Clostridia bacterium]
MVDNSAYDSIVGGKENCVISEKINCKKRILLGWVMVFALLAGFVSAVVIEWVVYKQYQTYAAGLMKIVFLASDEEIDSDYSEFLNDCYWKVSPEPLMAFAASVYGYDSSELYRLQNDIRSQFRKMMETGEKGYPSGWDVAYVFLIDDFGEYIKIMTIPGYHIDVYPTETVLLNFSVLILFIVSFILVLVTTVINGLHKNQQMFLDAEKITCVFNKKKKIDITYSRISRFEKKPFRAIRIVCPAQRITVSMLKNQIELMNFITDNVNRSKVIVPVQASTLPVSAQSDSQSSNIT